MQDQTSAVAGQELHPCTDSLKFTCLPPQQNEEWLGLTALGCIIPNTVGSQCAWITWGSFSPTAGRQHAVRNAHISPRGSQGVWGAAGRRGIPLPSPPCNATLILLLSLLAGAKVALPKCSPLLPFFCSFASESLTHAQGSSADRL